MKKSISFYIGTVLVAIVALMAVVGIFYTPYEPDTIDAASRNLSPCIKHLFGTDKYGRDVFSRCLVGAGTTMLVSLCVVAIGAVIGTIVGAVTGYFGGIADEIIMRINDGIASFPSILLALIFVSLFDSGMKSVIIVLGILFIPSFARVVRSEYKREREKDYVKCIRLYGAGSLRIMFKHILPNIKQSLFCAIAIGINNAILAEAGLSYLGLGVQPPTASLGRMMSEGQTFIFKSPWNCIFPGLVIVFAVLGFSLISEELEKTAGDSIKEIRSRYIRMWRENLKEKSAADGTATDRAATDKAVTDKAATDRTATDRTAAERIDNDRAATDRNVNDRNAGKTSGQACAKKLLSMKNLSVAVNTSGRLTEVVHQISFDIYEGEVLGFVGESGSGKSMSASAIMGLLGEKGTAEFECEFDGVRLDKLGEKELGRLRGKKITQVFQEPMTSLNPSKKIGWQMEELLSCHEEILNEYLEQESNANNDIQSNDNVKKEAAIKKLIFSAMEDAGIDECERIYSSYPFELSGGQRQRVLIAMAIISRPKLLICDEPTTALDADVADRILTRLHKLHQKYGMSIMFISHDISVIRRMCDRVAVMKDGRIIEAGSVDEIMVNPEHEYTKLLINAAKGYKGGKEGVVADKNVLEVNNLSVHYNRRHLIKRADRLEVIDNLSFDVKKGETLGIVGESGSGKTTIVKAVAGMLRYEGTISKTGRLAMVFQDPYSSLNASMTVGNLLREVAVLDRRRSGGRLRRDSAAIVGNSKQLIENTLEAVGLGAEYADRYPSELSGGQRQRVSIAMAIIARPELIILDEPVTALDVTVSQKILELLAGIKKEYGLSYILISHDAKLVENMCTRCIYL